MKAIVEYFSDEKISFISEYLLSKKHNKHIMNELEELNDIMKNYLYVERFKRVNEVINKYYENKNFNFTISFILKLINEYDFLLVYRYDRSKMIFYTVNDTEEYLGDETTKVIKLFTMGNDGIGLEIINAKTLSCCSILLKENTFEVYTAKLKDIGELITIYDSAVLDWEKELTTKLITTEDIDNMNDKIITKII